MSTLSVTDLARYERVQNLARQTLNVIGSRIRPGQNVRGLVETCRQLMDSLGATAYWWHGVPALILNGPRLRESMEGDAFQPSDEPIDADDMVTIDLSPEIDGYWGDAARTFFLRDGVPVGAAQAGAEQATGMAAQAALHARLLATTTPEMTFGELHAQTDAHVAALGFENLDFLSNYGHSISRDLHARAFIDAHCHKRLDSVPLFTFEPHIARPGSAFAFKYEEVYRFEGGRLRLL